MWRGSHHTALFTVRQHLQPPAASYSTHPCRYRGCNRVHWRLKLELAGAVKLKDIEERIKKDTEKLFAEGSKDIDRRFWPKRSNDVPNRPVLTLVVLGVDTPAGEPATKKLMESIVRDCGTSGRTYKSALIFTVPESAESIREAARRIRRKRHPYCG